MTQPPSPHTPSTELPGCWWHPNRQTGLSCVRCGRPACPDCLREASVGYQCIDCVQLARRESHTQRRRYRSAGYGSRTVAGARLSQRLIVTPVLIALNVLIYAITAAQAGSAMNNQASPLFLDWVEQPASIVLYGEWWRLFTTGFLHYGLIHIAVNMFSLWVLGRELEPLLGKIRFTAVYLVSLLGGSLAVFLFDNVLQQAAGASGAIYGLLGGILVAVLRLRLNPAPAIGIIVINLVISVSIANISLLAHLGGLIVGALATVALVYAPEKRRTQWQVGAIVVLVVALVGLALLRDAQLANLSCGYVRGGQVVCST
ncbi:rhomboid family intramembrane serine protease [Amycolatopsis sp. K13G38]|uniref:Rhomboid family intramembrane serine protease n=1 Tax=Amycolatopsis acididurans TaxID=2724524 RepID=A0ABX1J4R4_9PSEU|nr:rhomboid family intramembrane serine protease [Amycolatopsis acididurans]NKQ53335.1 rhomboid family intramembrane serine protease [Amycolatopsis acididurans]